MKNQRVMAYLPCRDVGCYYNNGSHKYMEKRSASFILFFYYYHCITNVL